MLSKWQQWTPMELANSVNLSHWEVNNHVTYAFGILYNNYLLCTHRSSTVCDGQSSELHHCDCLLEWGSVLQWKWSSHPLPCAVSVHVQWYCTECNNWYSQSNCFRAHSKHCYIHSPSGCSSNQWGHWTIQQSYQHIRTWYVVGHSVHSCALMAWFKIVLTAVTTPMCQEDSGTILFTFASQEMIEDSIVCRRVQFIHWPWSAGRSCCACDCAAARSCLYRSSTPYPMEVSP